MQDKHRSQVSQLEAKLSKAERAHQELQRVQQEVERLEHANQSLREELENFSGTGSSQASSSAGGDKEREREKDREQKALGSKLEQQVSENRKLQEERVAEQKKCEKMAAALDELQRKNEKLMSALMVQSGQVYGRAWSGGQELGSGYGCGSGNRIRGPECTRCRCFAMLRMQGSGMTRKVVGLGGLGQWWVRLGSGDRCPIALHLCRSAHFCRSATHV